MEAESFFESTSSASNSGFDIQELRGVVERNIKLCNYENALYWADKVMTLTADNAEDVLVFANCLYQTGQYHRAIAVVSNRDSVKSTVRGIHLIANCNFACNNYEETVTVLTEYLDEVQTEPPQTSTGSNAEDTPVSAMHLLLGKAYEAIGNYDLATDEFKKALQLDVYCQEAFEKIIGHHLLTASQEQELLEKLPFKTQSRNNSSLLSTLYGMQVKKYACHETMSVPSEVCSLQENLDVIVSVAERLYYNCYFMDAYKITFKVLRKEPFHLKCLPLHIALLVELRKSNDLFYLAHELVATYPRNVVSWFAVACYYHLIKNNDLARQYFSKATSIDPLFGPAWLAYGHSFAAESEHDQAMAAYSRASQLMKGCHLPFLYIGLEYGLTSTSTLAEKFFLQALSISPKDPFVLHEIGVIEFQNERYPEAEAKMTQALDMLNVLDMKRVSPMWEPLLNNMAHLCRKLKRYEEAVNYHKKTLSLQPRNASTFSAIGYNYMLMLRFGQAVEYFHKALAVRKSDSFTSELLKTAIDELVNDTEVHGDAAYEPLEMKDSLRLSMLTSDSFHPDSMATEDVESVPNTPRDAAKPPDTLTDSANMSMDMSMDDL